MRTITTYRVAGMTCSHCVDAVTEELNEVPGVLDITVTLSDDGPSAVRVTSEDKLEEDLVRAAVDEAGYELSA